MQVKMVNIFHSECLESFIASIAVVGGPVETLGLGKASSVRHAKEWFSQSPYGH